MSPPHFFSAYEMNVHQCIALLAFNQIIILAILNSRSQHK